MKVHLAALALAGALGAPVSAATFQFSLGGFDDGGFLTGTISGAPDINGDIVVQNDPTATFMASYTGGLSDFTFTEADANNVTFDIATMSFEIISASYFLAPPDYYPQAVLFFIPDTFGSVGIFSDTGASYSFSYDQMRVTMVGAAVPLPATALLLAGALGALGMVRRRRRAL